MTADVVAAIIKHNKTAAKARATVLVITVRIRRDPLVVRVQVPAGALRPDTAGTEAQPGIRLVRAGALRPDTAGTEAQTGIRQVRVAVRV